jgi:hypothetical protein
VATEAAVLLVMLVTAEEVLLVMVMHHLLAQVAAAAVAVTLLRPNMVALVAAVLVYLAKDQTARRVLAAFPQLPGVVAALAAQQEHQMVEVLAKTAVLELYTVAVVAVRVILRVQAVLVVVAAVRPSVSFGPEQLAHSHQPVLAHLNF